MARVPSTTDLIQEVREQADEFNVAAKSDDAIVRVLNRGLRFVSSELARTWEEPLIARASFDPSKYNPNVGFDLPDDIFEDRVTYVQVDTPAAPTSIQFRSYTQVTALNIRGSRSFVPVAAYQKGRALFLVPQPGASYAILVDYVRLPDPVTKPIGRITAVDLTGDAVSVSDLDEAAVSSDITSQLAYVNVIDGLTGVVKATRQVQLIQGERLGFRASPSRTTVEGRHVSGAFTVDGPFEPDGVTVDVAIGDYLCPVDGTCVLQLGQAFTSYLVQYAVAEIGRSLGDTTALLSKQIADRGEQAARQQRAGRPAIVRVKNRSKTWGIIRPSAYPYIPS